MEIIVRATLMFVVLWALTRGLGKRQLAEITPFELLLLVTMGDLIQQGVTGEDFSITGSILAVGTIATLVLVTSYASYRWPRARLVLDGAPLVLVDRGRIHRRRMHWERLTMEDLREEARTNGVASLDDVELAVLEPDGRFSFLTRDPGSSPGADEPEEPQAEEGHPHAG